MTENPNIVSIFRQILLWFADIDCNRLLKIVSHHRITMECIRCHQKYHQYVPKNRRVQKGTKHIYLFILLCWVSSLNWSFPVNTRNVHANNCRLVTQWCLSTDYSRSQADLPRFVAAAVYPTVLLTSSVSERFPSQRTSSFHRRSTCSYRLR